MRILAVKQPWASLLVQGHKPVENRGRSTPYRGDVAILASKYADTSGFSDTMRRQYLRTDLDDLPHRAIIGVVELYDVVTELESDWFMGEYGWLVRNARQLRHPIPMVGQLGLIKCADYIEAEIRSQL